MTQMMKEIVQDLRLATKFLLGAIVSLALAMQLDVVKNYVTPILAGHPKLTSIVMGIAGLGLLLMNPQVRKVLHIDDLEKEEEPVQK